MGMGKSFLRAYKNSSLDVSVSYWVRTPTPDPGVDKRVRVASQDVIVTDLERGDRGTERDRDTEQAAGRGTLNAAAARFFAPSLLETHQSSHGRLLAV
jgi:hypothetical protein